MSLSNLIDIATDERQTEDNWTKIIDVCEKGSSNSKECLRLILRRLFNKNPHIVLRSIILLDACVQNIGEPFTKELSSRYFVNEIKTRSKNLHQKALERLCFMMKKWSRELVGSEYDCINELNKWLKDTYPAPYAAGDNELNSRNSLKGSRKNITVQEEDDLARAIALSLKDSEQKRSNLYPTNITGSTTNSVVKLANNENVQAKKSLPKVRALYDFEAAEDNELTFKAGEIIIDVDTSNEHWWYGSNHRGQGMFPAQFVTINVDSDSEKLNDPIVGTNEKSNIQQINQIIESHPARAPTPVIDESKVDECLLLIEDTDPTGEIRPDPPELAKLEAQCRAMGPLIDQELEKIDRHYNMLVDLNRKTIESFQLYNELMMTQGGYNRQSNYMWMQNVPQMQYVNKPMQDPSQGLPRTKDTVGLDSHMGRADIPMMFPQNNYYGTMNPIQNQQDMMYVANQQFNMTANQTLSQPNQNYTIPPNLAPSNQNQQQHLQEPPNNINNSAMANLNYTDMNLRSLPVQVSSVQSANINHQQNFPYIQKGHSFPIQDGGFH